MDHSTCIVCGVSTDTAAKLLSFDVPLCNGCWPAANLRREEIVAAIVKVLRS